MKRFFVGVGVLALALIGLAAPRVEAAAPARPRVTAPVRIDEYRLSGARMSALRNRWVDQLEATYGDGHWAPLKMSLDDRDLALMGLPRKSVLTSHRYPRPTWFDAKGGAHTTGKPSNGGGGSGGTAQQGVVAVAGAGWAGIRPGAWLLFVTPNEVGWCSAAHVYGAPGSYQISTAGHCGKAGDIVSMIGLVGGHQFAGQTIPVLLDIGKISKSTGDTGVFGKDWALISVYPELQNLVTPTMAFWGGPKGAFTKTGQVVAADLLPGNKITIPPSPQVSVTPDPFLAQQILHYGHGAGVGAGGTPRTGTAIAWFPTYFTWFGAITPGDSGSGSNTLLGDTVGAEREAAGINTHIYVDASLRSGLGNVASTRVTQVTATLADGQLVPYPAPVAGAP